MEREFRITEAPEHAASSAPSRGVARAAIELALVTALAIAWFFGGVGTTRFIQTEVLRALVAREMHQRGDWTPTVHERAYVRKLPLHAWITSSLAELVGRFDEQVARWPSAAMGVLYVLTMFSAAIWLIDPRAGPAAAVLAAGNWEVLDYCTRADLDAGVLAWTSLAVILLGVAWTKRGARRFWWLTGCYAAALVGSYWKAPHVLFTVWLALLGLYWTDDSEGHRAWRRFTFHPVHLALAGACLVALAAWQLALVEMVGGARAGKFVLIEALARLVPHAPSHLLGMITAIPQFALVGFPASALAALLLSRTGREWLRHDAPVAATVLSAWLIPTALFMLVIPAKAGRYWFLCLGAVTLLGTLVWRRYATGALPSTLSRACTNVVHGLLVIGLGVGSFLVVLASLSLGPMADLPEEQLGLARAVCLGCGLFMIAVAGGAWWRRTSMSRTGLGAALVVITLAVKPVHAWVYVPARAGALSTSDAIATVEAEVPETAPVFVLSNNRGSDRAGEMADFGYYCKRDIRWPENVAQALSETEGPTCYLLLRSEARERIERMYGDRAVMLAEVERYNDLIALVALDVDEASEVRSAGE